MSQSTGSRSGENAQPGILAAGIITGALALIAVVLRFVSKRLAGAKFWLDDWTVVIAFAFAVGMLATIYAGFEIGLGTHQSMPPEPLGEMATLLKQIFAGQICYRLSLVFSKYSLLALYWRLFNKQKHIRISIYILGAITTAWGISTVLASILQCIPVSDFWHPLDRASCRVSSYEFFMGTSIPNTVTDALLLIVPLPSTWRLDTSKTQKIALSATFLLGTFVCVISIVRLAVIPPGSLTQHDDLTWNYAYVAVWSLVEVNSAVLCTCLSSLHPVLIFFTTGSFRWTLNSPQARWKSLSYSKGEDDVATILRKNRECQLRALSAVDRVTLRPDILDLNTTSGDIGMGTKTLIETASETGQNQWVGLEEGIQVRKEVVIT